MLQTPDGHARLELSKFHTPSTQGGNRQAPANTPGIRHVAFAVEDIDAVVAGLRARGAELVGELERYEHSYRLCYVRGPEGSSSSWPSRGLTARTRPGGLQARTDSRQAPENESTPSGCRGRCRR
jgi:catechol 2,3-dioxygenase-like lactoylglutathione lyase family enzyme